MKNQKELDQQFMQQAIDLAKTAAENGNEPFGAVLVRNGKVVAFGKNEIHTHSDPTFHAEIGLLREYCSANQVTDLASYTLYTSCEPCCMCSGAMVWCNLGRMVYSLGHEELAEIAGFNIMLGSEDVFEKSPNRPEVSKGVLTEAAKEVYQDYFGK